jgi:predicted nucleic-acid-binding protein
MKGVDTNVLVRYITKDHAVQERAASRFLDLARKRAEPIFVNVIVLCELVWVLGRTYEYSRAEIAAVIGRLLATEQIVVENADLAGWPFRTSRPARQTSQTA